MKKLLGVLVGMGLVGLVQGCTGAEYKGDAEDVGSQSDAVTSACVSNQGIFPTKAALAVAMGIELGHWDPLNDLQFGSSGHLELKPTVTCLKNDCKNTKALLGQASYTPDQNQFSANSYNADLLSARNRQTNLIQNLTKNFPDQLPPAHKLTLVGGPKNLGLGSCGPHYIFQVDNLNGTPLTSTQATNMSNTLCYFGQDTATTGCGSNPFVGFTKTQQNCPSGRVCVAIDPSDGDNGSVVTTTSGIAPTYPLNRLWDPANDMLNSVCIKTAGGTSSLQSKCSSYPSTCGYLYCI
jgi:hypothetical protein